MSATGRLKPAPPSNPTGKCENSRERKLLLVKKRNKDVELTLPQPAKKVQFVDQTTKNNPPGTRFSRLKLART